MGKNRKKKTPGIQKIPGVGLQTSHFKHRVRGNAAAIADPDIHVVHESLSHPDVIRAPATQRLGPKAGTNVLPPGTHIRTSNFTVRNYSTCQPTGQPLMPGICDWCQEYYFDLTPHFWSFHELDLVLAADLARSASAIQ